MIQPPSNNTMDPSTTEEGRDHNENKEGFTSLEGKNSEMEQEVLTPDSVMDLSIQQDGRDHYENKEVKELSRGNKQYLMLVHPENGDDIDEGLDLDGKIDDSLDIEGQEFGYQTSSQQIDILTGSTSSLNVDTTNNSKVPDTKESDNESFKGNVEADSVFVTEKSDKDGNESVKETTDRRTGVSYSQQQSENILPESIQSNPSEEANTQNALQGDLTQSSLQQGEVTQSALQQGEVAQSALQAGEITQNSFQPDVNLPNTGKGPVQSVFQSNSTDNLRNIGYRDSISSDISLPDVPEPVEGHYHKVSPLPNGNSDTDDTQEHIHQENAKVGRRKTWGSWEFGGFFRSKNRQNQTGVQRRSSFASRPVTKSASQADILCGECDYCVNLPQHNRLLQTQLDKTEKDFKKKEDDLTSEIKVLKKENERQQKLIGQNLTLGPEAKIEATMQHEITRLTGENLDLRETIDKQTDQIRKLKKMLKVYSRKLKDGEAAEIQAELEREEMSRENGGLATVKHRQRIYLGMLEYRKEDEGALLKNLIQDLKPRIAAGLLPGLPAYILFMCVRHTDYTNDDEKVRALLTGTINSIKKVVKKHPDDMERYTLWLANTCRILHTLKQYSGEKTFQSESTTKQNEQCLRNFDLSDYRQVFSDLAVWIYQGLIKLMQEHIQPNIVAAVLEHEAIAGLTASKPSGLRGRSTSNARDLEDDEKASLDSLMKALNNYMRIVTQHAVDPELVKQIFRQLFYFICAGALNNLLLRKDMCNWSKGMQIRYNISHLEQWLRDNKLHESGAASTLETIIQASQLLQARKTDADVESVCEMCSKLTLAQIVKILNLYTPVDEFEERVPISFIRKIQEKMKHKQGPNNTLLMETKFSYPVTFPFNPSSIAMETIEVPEALHIGFVKRI